MVVAPVRVAVPWEWTAGWAADGERDCAEVRLRGQTPVACVAVVGEARAGASGGETVGVMGIPVLAAHAPHARGSADDGLLLGHADHPGTLPECQGGRHCHRTRAPGEHEGDENVLRTNGKNRRDAGG